MPDHWIYDHYTDLSSENGFQFEFYCERCPEAWRSGFVRYTEGRLPGAMDAASRLMGPRNAAARGVATFRGGAWDRARDAAFRKAARTAGEHFHDCPKCRSQCCPGCWSATAECCATCVSSGVAHALSRRRGAALGQPIGRCCSECARPVGGASFCPHCGAGLGEKQACRACRTTIPVAVRFCPSCGERARK
jgi:hypothetical protein